VPPITINLPPSVLKRLLAEVPAKERDSFATCALIEALDKRMSSCLQPKKALEEHIMSPTIKSKAGRPPPPVPKSKKSLYLDEQVWKALEAAAKKTKGGSVSSSANQLLRNALSLDR
jgi:hypothetical protein